MSDDLFTKLIAHSVKIGTNLDLVQASGGNISYKQDGQITVKASGKRLKDAASKNIFVTLDISNLNEDLILSTENFSYLSQGELAPSIETNFHILLQNKFVTHVHSIGAIAVGVSPGLARHFINMWHQLNLKIIPYVRPGIALAQQIIKVQDFQKSQLLLQNHGIVVSGNSFQEIEDFLDAFEAEVLRIIENLPTSESNPTWVEILTSGVLTPDEAVFLGESPFVSSEKVSERYITINSNHIISIPENFRDDQTKLAEFYIKLAKILDRKVTISYLDPMEVIELLNWDKEILRKAEMN
jgi:rhamnose utilization protein RhaD (predicted bifunctional aldolase and dehydrogenase)